jgi:hypothetical protein
MKEMKCDYCGREVSEKETNTPFDDVMCSVCQHNSIVEYALRPLEGRDPEVVVEWYKEEVEHCIGRKIVEEEVLDAIANIGIAVSELGDRLAEIGH